MRTRIAAVIQRIRPAIQQDGSDLELIGVVDGVATVKLSGHCVACATTRQALLRGIARAIQAEVPEVTRVDVLT